MVVGILEDAESLRDALRSVPTNFPDRWTEIAGETKPVDLVAELPIANERVLSTEDRLTTYRVTDQRDWRNQVHGGERVVMRTRLTLRHAAGEGAA